MGTTPRDSQLRTRARFVPRRIGALGIVGMLLAAPFAAIPAHAADVSEIVTRWAEGTPPSSQPAAVVSAEVRINVNDDRPAPSNDPVENFTATFTVANATFEALPDICLVTGVETPSAISADGSSMSCNFGTQVQGTALALQVPMRITGGADDEVSFDASVGSVNAPTLTHSIVTDFSMDLTLEEPSAVSTGNGNIRTLQFEWTLNLGKGSEAGPDSVSYVLVATPTTGTLTRIDSCAPFTDQLPSGHPNSGAGSPAERTAPTADCVITPLGGNQYQMTLTGIDYSLAQVPTESSGGDTLPVDRTAVASGRFLVVVNAPDAGSVQVQANTPTYTSVQDQTSVDDAANNTATKSWANPGLWISSWNRHFTESGGSPFDDTYRMSAGSTVQQSTYFAQLAAGLPLADNNNMMLCTILDTRYVDYDSASTVRMPNDDAEPDAQIQWYVGSTQAALNPDAPGYNPGAILNCGDLAGGAWVDTEPADKTAVQAVRAAMTFGAMKDNRTTELQVRQTIQDDAPSGMDVWQFSSRWVGGNLPQSGWAPTSDDGVINPVANARYPHTNGTRDILRVVALTPFIEKSAETTTLTIGSPVTFTLDYSANGGASAPATVDDYTIVDTLPIGVEYVVGSASPEPTITDAGGQEVLTWALDGVATNTTNRLTYQVQANDQAVPGQRLENVATASVQGQVSAPATATITVSTSGRTIIGKSADQGVIPNGDGDGAGEASWTVSLRSEDPTAQTFTDVIDILPYNGDGRGTAFSGSYVLDRVEVSGGGTVYYTTASSAELTDDPAAAANGAAGTIDGNTVGWTTTAPASGTTAVRVIGGVLAPAAERSFRVFIQTDGAEGGDVYVNRAQARASHTELVMRTSAPISVSQFYGYDLKKYVQDSEGEWHDAQDTNEADWPILAPGATAVYKFVLINTGQGDLTDITVTDPLLGDDWAWNVPSLPAGGQVESEEFTYTLTEADQPSLRNQACATTALPDDSTQGELVDPCDEANLLVGGYTVSKTSDPASGTTVQVGDVVTYTVEVRHTGAAEVTAQFVDVLTDVLDDATYNGDAAASAGVVSVAGDRLSWSGQLVEGDVVTVTYSVVVKTGGDRVLTNVIPTPNCISAPDGNEKCTTTHELPPTGALAQTGAVALTGYAVAAGVLLLVGAGLVIAVRRRASAAQR